MRQGHKGATAALSVQHPSCCSALQNTCGCATLNILCPGLGTGRGIAAVIYFVTFLMAATMIMLNLVVAVILDKFVENAALEGLFRTDVLYEVLRKKMLLERFLRLMHTKVGGVACWVQVPGGHGCWDMVEGCGGALCTRSSQPSCAYRAPAASQKVSATCAFDTHPRWAPVHALGSWECWTKVYTYVEQELLQAPGVLFFGCLHRWPVRTH